MGKIQRKLGLVFMLKEFGCILRQGLLGPPNFSLHVLCPSLFLLLVYIDTPNGIFFCTAFILDTFGNDSTEYHFALLLSPRYPVISLTLFQQFLWM
jgi:hypothetical protein